MSSTHLPLDYPPTTPLPYLPHEVLHQVFTHLPSDSLLPIRLVSRRSNLIITTDNSCWKNHLLHTLPSRHPAIGDLARTLPHDIWSFGLFRDGWFQAYLAIRKAMKEPWLTSEDVMVDTEWFVYFNHHVSADDLGWVKEHARIKYYSNQWVHRLSGLFLHSKIWKIKDGCIHVTGYPPNVPSRDPGTLCRVLSHCTATQLSPSPELLAALRNLNAALLDHALAEHIITPEEFDTWHKNFREAWERVDWSPAATLDRLGVFLRECDTDDEEEEEEEDEEEEEEEDEDEEDGGDGTDCGAGHVGAAARLNQENEYYEDNEYDDDDDDEDGDDDDTFDDDHNEPMANNELNNHDPRLPLLPLQSQQSDTDPQQSWIHEDPATSDSRGVDAGGARYGGAWSVDPVERGKRKGVYG